LTVGSTFPLEAWKKLPMQTERLEVTGMTCGGCSRKVNDALKAVRGVNTVAVSLADHEATVSFDPEQASLGQLEAAVRNAGYGVGEGATAETAQVSGCHCGAK
jgi:copper chaperone CopZ